MYSIKDLSNISQVKFVFFENEIFDCIRVQASNSVQSKKKKFKFKLRRYCITFSGVQVYGSCNFPLDVGKFCERRLAGTRYRHDPSTGECQSFSYRGCGGNSNNYANIWDCQQACGELEIHCIFGFCFVLNNAL